MSSSVSCDNIQCSISLVPKSRIQAQAPYFVIYLKQIQCVSSTVTSYNLHKNRQIIVRFQALFICEIMQATHSSHFRFSTWPSQMPVKVTTVFLPVASKRRPCFNHFFTSFWQGAADNGYNNNKTFATTSSRLRGDITIIIMACVTFASVLLLSWIVLFII